MAGIQIRVSNDKLNAFVVLKDDGRPPRYEEILRMLKSFGIKYGIDNEKIKELEILPRYETPILVAMGVPPEKGVDARIEYPFLEKLEEAQKRKKKFVIVKEGDVLAIKHPATPGKEGINVYGEPVPPQPGKDMNIRVGKNVKLIQNGLVAVATRGGIPRLIEDTVLVDEKLYIDGDVDYSTGNIDFPGSVEITGTVKPGFVVKAKEDIIIKNVIDAATVISFEGTVEAKGVKGREKGLVKGRMIKASFLENANVEAEQDVIVQGSVVNSVIKAGGMVICEGEKASIIGGYMVVGKKVVTTDLGSEMAVHTRVEVGTDPRLVERLKTLQAQVRLDRENLERLNRVISSFKAKMERSKRELPKEQKEALAKAVQTLINLREAIEKNEEEIKKIRDRIGQESKDAMIVIKGTAYPGVEVTMFSRKYSFNKPISKLVIIFRDNEIVFRGYEGES